MWIIITSRLTSVIFSPLVARRLSLHISHSERALSTHPKYQCVPIFSQQIPLEDVYFVSGDIYTFHSYIHRQRLKVKYLSWRILE